MFEVAILTSSNYSPQVSASGEESSFWLRSCKFEGPAFRCLARVVVNDAERGWDPSVYICVEKHSRGCGRKLAKIRNRHREHASLRNANAPPALNARLALQAPRRMGACFFCSSITCLRVPGANSWSWLRELRVNRGLGLSYCEC